MNAALLGQPQPLECPQLRLVLPCIPVQGEGEEEENEEHDSRNYKGRGSGSSNGSGSGGGSGGGDGKAGDGRGRVDAVVSLATAVEGFATSLEKAMAHLEGSQALCAEPQKDAALLQLKSALVTSGVRAAAAAQAVLDADALLVTAARVWRRVQARYTGDRSRRSGSVAHPSPPPPPELLPTMLSAAFLDEQDMAEHRGRAQSHDQDQDQDHDSSEGHAAPNNQHSRMQDLEPLLDRISSPGYCSRAADACVHYIQAAEAAAALLRGAGRLAEAEAHVRQARAVHAQVFNN